MSADGTWKLSMQTPVGERKVTLDLKSSGAALSGKLTADEGGSTEIFDGKADGDNLAFETFAKRRENFGPHLKLKLGQPHEVSGHKDHIHFSVN